MFGCRNCTSQEPDANTLQDTRLDARRLLDLGRVRVSAFTHPELVRRFDPEARHLSITWPGTDIATGRKKDKDLVDLTLSGAAVSCQDEPAVGGRTTAVVKALIPHPLLPLPPGRTGPLFTACLPVGGGIGALLAGFLTHLITDTTPYSPSDAARLGAVVIDLTAALLTQHHGTEPRHVLVPQIQAFIQRHLSDPRLTPDLIATAHHISPRSLHRLFQNEGTTVGAWIRSQRLNRCRRDLADPAQSSQPIHAIAARWGFPRPADFTRAFRAAYGVAPREYRTTMLHGTMTAGG